jgi:hypothetical protein
MSAESVRKSRFLYSSRKKYSESSLIVIGVYFKHDKKSKSSWIYQVSARKKTYKNQIIICKGDFKISKISFYHESKED